MSWSVKKLKETSNVVLLKIVGQPNSTDTSIEIDWNDLSSLLADYGYSRNISRDDVEIKSILSSSADWKVSGARGSELVKANYDIKWLSTLGAIDQETSINSIMMVGGKIGLCKESKKRTKNLRKPSGTHSKIKLNSDNLLGVGTHSNGSTTNKILRIDLTSGTPVANTFGGAVFYITFGVNT